MERFGDENRQEAPNIDMKKAEEALLRNYGKEAPVPLPEGLVDLVKDANLYQATLREYKHDDKKLFKVIYSYEDRYRVTFLTHKLIEKLKTSGTTDIVLLDKQARPIATLLQEMWPLESGGKMPNIHFINIGREKLESGRDEDMFGYTPILKLTLEEIENSSETDLQEAIAKDDPDYFKKIKERYTKKGESKSVFADGHILIVDEMQHTGSTIVLAKKLFDFSFKNEGLDVETYYFDSSEGEVKKDEEDDYENTDNQKEERIYDPMPWTQGKWPIDLPVGGITGVVEPENPSDFLSKPLSEEWVQKRLEFLKEAQNERPNDNSIKEEIEAVSKARESYQLLRQELKWAVLEYYFKFWWATSAGPGSIELTRHPKILDEYIKENKLKWKNWNQK